VSPADKFTVTEVNTFRLDHACPYKGCVRIFTIRMAGTQEQASAAKNTPPPNVNGWRDGYCPDHATTDGSSVKSKQ